MKYDVFLVNFGYFASAGHKTLADAIKAAKKTGFQCSIFERDASSTGPYDPIGKLVQFVSPIQRLTLNYKMLLYKSRVKKQESKNDSIN